MNDFQAFIATPLGVSFCVLAVIALAVFAKNIKTAIASQVDAVKSLLKIK